MEEFKTLAINDPRVLQACMELSVKTPAQVLQEYQNRNRGVSINYNTVPCDNDGVKLFKTIVTAGNTVAEVGCLTLLFSTITSISHYDANPGHRIYKEDCETAWRAATARFAA